MNNLDAFEVALFAKAFNINQENKLEVLAKIECIDDLLSVRKEALLFNAFNRTRKGYRSKQQITVDSIVESRLQQCIEEIKEYKTL